MPHNFLCRSFLQHFSRTWNALSIEKEEKEFLSKALALYQWRVVIHFPPFPDPRSSVLTLGRVPITNVLQNVMTAHAHLHETIPYFLCCKGVDPKVSSSTSDLRLSVTVCLSRFCLQRHSMLRIVFVSRERLDLIRHLWMNQMPSTGSM